MGKYIYNISTMKHHIAVKMKNRVKKQQQRSRLQKDLCSSTHLYVKIKTCRIIPQFTQAGWWLPFEANKRNAFLQEEIKGNFKGVCDTLFLKVINLLFSILFCIGI